MYTEDSIKELFSRRGEAEMELSIYRAQYHSREDSMPVNMQDRIDELERTIMTIDSMFYALSTNERFVIQMHVVEQLDWPQVLGEYVKRWGKDSEKTIRSLQIYQTKALKKIVYILDHRMNFPCTIPANIDKERS